MRQTITINVNGKDYSAEIQAFDSLNRVLREYLGLTGTKRACDYGGCGSCTVILDGKAVYSCMVPAIRAQGKKVLTIEGLENDGKLHPLQEAFIEYQGLQCGFCTPGIIMTAKALLDQNPNPTESEVKWAISGNLCRCTGYIKVVQAILQAGKVMRDHGIGRG